MISWYLSSSCSDFCCVIHSTTHISATFILIRTCGLKLHQKAAWMFSSCSHIFCCKKLTLNKWSLICNSSLTYCLEEEKEKSSSCHYQICTDVDHSRFENERTIFYHDYCIYFLWQGFRSHTSENKYLLSSYWDDESFNLSHNLQLEGIWHGNKLFYINTNI